MPTRGRRILMGCGLGCAGMIVLSIGACVSFSVWIKQPGELLEPTRLLGRDTTGYVEWSLRGEDPGTAEFIEKLIALSDRAQARNPGQGPDWLNQLLRRQRGQKNAEAVRKLLPTVVAWTIRPGETDDADLHLFSVSIKSLGNQSRFMDLMMRFTIGLKHSVKHADERIYSIDEGAMFIRNNTFYVTNSEANARLFVDRLRGDAWEIDRDPTELELRVQSLPENRPLNGFVSNSRGELWRIWSTVAELESDAPPPELWRTLLNATLTGSFTGQTAFAGTIDLQGPDAAWARDHADEFLAQVRSEYGRGHLAVELKSEAAGDRIRLSFHVDDVFAFLDEM